MCEPGGRWVAHRQAKKKTNFHSKPIVFHHRVYLCCTRTGTPSRTRSTHTHTSISQFATNEFYASQRRAFNLRRCPKNLVDHDGAKANASNTSFPKIFFQHVAQNIDAPLTRSFVGHARLPWKQMNINRNQRLIYFAIHSRIMNYVCIF